MLRSLPIPSATGLNLLTSVVTSLPDMEDRRMYVFGGGRWNAERINRRPRHLAYPHVAGSAADCAGCEVAA